MSEFTFLYPLWLLGLIPWLMLLVWLSKRQKSQTLIAPHLAKAMGLQVKRSKSALLSIIAATGAITLIALAGPSFSSQERPSFANTSARVVVMDMSMSMYATDIKPNRLTQARYKVTDLLNSWQDGTTALVAYAGDAYVVSPMTSDTRTIANLMPSLSPEIMPYPGANAAKGVELAVEVMQNTGAGSGNIVLVTDDIDAKEKQDIESLLSGSNWRLTILGLGSRAGAPIQLQDGTLMTMDNGQPVVAKSDFAAMQSLASAVNGQFIPVQLTNRDVEQIVNLTSQVDGTSLNNKQHKIEERINQGFWLLPLLLIPALLMFRKGVFFSALLLILPLTKPTPAQASPWLTQNQQAMQQYNAGEYEQAAEQFNDPRWKGIAQYQAGDYQAAIDSLQSDTSLEGKYNLANAFAQAQDFDKAIELYQQVLEQNPQHQDAKANLEVVKQAQQQQQQQQGDSGQSGDQKPNENNASESQNQQNGQSQPTDNENRKSSEQEQTQAEENKDEQQSSNGQQTEKHSDQESQQVPQSSKESSDESQDSSQQAPTLAKQDNQQQVDPQLRKLEQVESARDPSRLLRAQLMLQAQQKQPPQQSGKQW